MCTVLILFYAFIYYLPDDGAHREKFYFNYKYIRGKNTLYSYFLEHVAHKLQNGTRNSLYDNLKTPVPIMNFLYC